MLPVCVYDSNDSNVTSDTEAGADAYRFVVDDWYAFDGDEVFDPEAWTYLGVS